MNCNVATQNGMMSRLAGRAIERTDEDYDLDDVFTTRASRKDGKAEEERERERAIAEHQRERRWALLYLDNLASRTHVHCPSILTFDDFEELDRHFDI